MTRALISLFFLAAMIAASHASDGRYEISEHCAVLGCFPGDSPGLPVTLSQPGSYVLTSNLTTSDPNQNLIVLTTDNIAIDLNGFSLIGPNTCSGTPTTCTNSGSGNGIFSGSIRKGVRLVNGTIRGMGNYGADLNAGPGVFVENVSFVENGSHGLFINSASVQGIGHNLVAVRNGARGFSVFFGDMHIQNSVAINNNQSGQAGGSCSNNRYVGIGAVAGSLRSCESFGNNLCTYSGTTSSC